MIQISVKEVLSYNVSEHLANFADVSIEERQTYTNKFYATMFKALPNYAVGKTSERRDTLRVALPAKQKLARRLLPKTQYVNAFRVANRFAIVYLKRKKSYLPITNNAIAWHVLQEPSLLLL